MDNNKIYILDTQKDKPVKIIFENNISNVKTEKYHLTLRQVLFEILKGNWELRRNLTRQQIHSERGKVRRGNYEEVINFLNKRGVSREYINNEISQERENIIITIPLKINTEDVYGKFGLIQLT